MDDVLEVAWVQCSVCQGSTRGVLANSGSVEQLLTAGRGHVDWAHPGRNSVEVLGLRMGRAERVEGVPTDDPEAWLEAWNQAFPPEF
ncbi:hypothetical protein AB0E96_41375 [Kitasatospora sp. NPDC036755]|uniref:hypothetical protein n=1 Tax=Kitasatospora sp. NPDC036755 TaxID=3154600 RepID=UPI0033CC133F